MTPAEFYTWLSGYLEALESEGIETCKIKNIREKMNEIKTRGHQELVVFGPNANTQQGDDNSNPHNRYIV